ncbi:ABC transporter permease [Aminivibrio sp.]|uniref:ABC transporter permease n=1 Tax=Aminivibrio sp. TaxID=1872489 RepID=UPI0025C2CD72|nr:ABC transporter permease [Aminivibrio sp.]
MSGYWARRTGSALLVLGLVLVLNFVLFRMMPGDPVASIIDPNFSPEAKARLSEVYGLDQPLPVQFLLYVRSTLTFDFGISFLTGRPVIDELKSRLPNTVMLLGTSLVLSSLLGTWLGMKAALKRGSLLEKCVLWSGALSFSFPSFFVQLVLLMAFAAALPLFPLRGTLSVPPPAGGLPLLLDYLWHMALPVFSLVLLGFGGWALYVRNLMVKILGEDFILLARARGLPERNIILGHAFRTLLPPLLTIFLLSLPGVVSGAVITETVFSLHGVGRFLLEAVTGHDYPAAGASFFLLAFLTVSCNLLSDLLYGLTDPRVRMERGGRR